VTGAPQRFLRIIDAHNHIGDISVTGAISLARTGDPVPADGAVDADIANRLTVLDQRGVTQSVVIAPHGYLRPDGIADTRRVNDTVAAYRDRRPDRFPAAVGVVEPLYGERGYDELARCRSELGFLGISFHTRFQGVSTNSLWVRRYLERMAELGLVAFVHAVGESPEEALWKLEAVARDLPELPIVVLDAFSTFEQSMLVPIVAERCPNLVFDTATSHGWGFVAPLVQRCGASRLVYGSDLHSTSNARSELTDPLPDLLAAGLDQADLAAVVGGTIAGMLGLEAAVR
jgi:predicted TIM-barrel fold metal-dependent hydrolase